MDFWTFVGLLAIGFGCGTLLGFAIWKSTGGGRGDDGWPEGGFPEPAPGGLKLTSDHTWGAVRDVVETPILVR